MIKKIRSNISFRDPSGCLVEIGERLIRIVNCVSTNDTRTFLDLPFCADAISDNRLVQTRILGGTEVADLKRENENIALQLEACGMILEHKRVWFVSFPSEWAPEMLHAAAMLTLDMARSALADGFGLKDATPYNVLFQGSTPIFVDILSFERRKSGDHIWLAYAQFVRTFLLPLLVNRHFMMPLDQMFLSKRDGIEPKSVYKMASVFKRINPLFFRLVTLPALLEKSLRSSSPGLYETGLTGDPEKALYILEMLFKGLHKTLNGVLSTKKDSSWISYADDNSYSEEGQQLKIEFIHGVLKDFCPCRVLDVGCNTGVFSRLAARAGASVVAIDYDPDVVGEVWQMSRREGLDILPLVVNLARPTPAMGWNNEETSSFLDRAYGAFDTVFMLAVIHHMMVTDGIPLEKIALLAAKLTTDLLVVEFIDSDDTMFQKIVRGRSSLYSWFSRDAFEQVFGTHFFILRFQQIPTTRRWVYIMRKKDV